jgi:hypothetical protein
VGKIEQGMITYTYPWPEQPTFRVPKLHRVNYNPKYNWGEVQYWCKENCRAPSYMAMAWSGTFVEFEDDEDATLFSLKFS